MISKPLYCAGTTAAVRFALQYLQEHSIPTEDRPGWDVGHVLLDVPSFQGNLLRSGGNPDTLLQALPKDAVIWGGNLNHPALDGFFTVDLLKDEAYLAENAAITA